MSSSAEPLQQAGPPRLGTDLRSGRWTRLGADTVLGDAATESALHSLAENVRAGARAQGYATGWAEGRRAAGNRAEAQAQEHAREAARREAARAEEHDRAVAALTRAAQRLCEATEEICAAVESQAAEVALVMTEAVLGREVAAAADPGGDALRRALRLLPEDTPATVRLHPDDLAGLGVEPTGVTLTADPTLARGDAVVETADTVVDATVATALLRMREVLG